MLKAHDTASKTLQEVEAKRKQIDQLHLQQAAVDKQASEFRPHQAQLTDLIRELERMIQTSRQEQVRPPQAAHRQVFRHAPLRPDDQALVVDRRQQTGY